MNGLPGALARTCRTDWLLCAEEDVACAELPAYEECAGYSWWWRYDGNKLSTFWHPEFPHGPDWNQGTRLCNEETTR